MKPTDTYVRARIDKNIKELAENALHNMGISVSDAIRFMMFRIAKENKMPFAIKVPNKKTLEAIKDVENGKTKKFNTIEYFLKYLYI